MDDIPYFDILLVLRQWCPWTQLADDMQTLPGEPGQFHLWPGIGQGS